MKNHKQLFKIVIVTLLLLLHFYSYSQPPCPLTATQQILTPKVCQNDLGQVEFTATTQGTIPYTFTYLESGVTRTVTTVGTNSVAVVGVVTSVPGTVPYQLTGIQDASGCSTASVTVPAETLTINPLPQATLSGSGNVCQGGAAPVLTFAGITGSGTFHFTFSINGGDKITLAGQANDTLLYTTSADEPGTYIYSLSKVSDENCPNTIVGQTATISVDPNPQAAFIINPERISISDPTVTIDNFSIGVTDWKWDFGDSSISLSNNPVSHTYKDTGTYKIKLVATNSSQCKDSTYQIVKVYQPLKIFVPNAFTPNGDNINDEFKAQGDGIIKFEMQIFDNHGHIAFSSNDINKGWDGKSGSSNPPSQTFVYVINLRALNDKHDYTYRGVVTLVK